jgi:hypothetical protein
MAQTKAHDLEAFCATCPSQEEVGTILRKLGFRLVFHMEAQCDHRYQLPPLPAQYHYRHESGAEALYLAGRDTPMHEGGSAFPPHASRFWLTCGADEGIIRMAMSTLALNFQFTWQEAHEKGKNGDDEQEVA